MSLIGSFRPSHCAPQRLQPVRGKVCLSRYEYLAFRLFIALNYGEQDLSRVVKPLREIPHRTLAVASFFAFKERDGIWQVYGIVQETESHVVLFPLVAPGATGEIIKRKNPSWRVAVS